MSSGGTFALYSLLCRHAKLCMLPNQQDDDKDLSAYDDEGANTWGSNLLKDFFKKHPMFRGGLLVVVLLGTSMAIGAGVLTPTISGKHQIQVIYLLQSLALMDQTDVCQE